MSNVQPGAPTPFGPVPSERQLRRHGLEFYGFLHFTVNTFTDREWGYGDEDPSVFDPSDFDADAIVEAAAAGGMRGLILTCKHHDGFCLWPSRYTDHSVKHSPWRNGRGDMVRELSEACGKRGIGFGVYLSPWDRNHAAYGMSEYVEYYRKQLCELLEGYGELFEIWFDGANGGDGYYGGAEETRTIDKKTYYEWEKTHALVRELQPDACMFSDAGPDIRWVGNEDGVAGETCWATLEKRDFIPGEADGARLNRGDRHGGFWLPPECDVSIRPGWFYHAHEDDKVKSAEKLFDLYLRSVGRGGSFLLNLPPDRRGRIHEIDAKVLRRFRETIDRTFGRNLAADPAFGPAVEGPRRGGSVAFSPGNLLDGDPETYWAVDDPTLTPQASIRFEKPARFEYISLREYLPLGQRVDKFAVDAVIDNTWQEIAGATSIGNRRILRVRPIESIGVRIRILRASACPAMSELALHPAI
jgi:alpha-L-fucosidase